MVATELCHAIGATAILDLRVGSGHYAMAALRNRVPYCGATLTPTWVEQGIYERHMSGCHSCHSEWHIRSPF